ncbi:MAG: hypothetical protein HRU19_05005 [Pseudobacteriovorax sp.]|nr:hypothetical protein [Pseudobacteriovorax sp.]
MAIVFETTQDGCTYQVRSAGNSRRLYTNGILHTHYNPKHILTGSVWDLLLLGAFTLKKFNRPMRVLVLGVGGGAVLRQLMRFFPEVSITGIELNSIHLKLGEEYFGLLDPRVQLIQADAADWLKSNKGPLFDLVIDDVFGEVDGEPSRGIAFSESWFRQLSKRITAHGVLVVNQIEEDDFVLGRGQAHSHGFRSIFRVTTANCYNIVSIYSRSNVTSSEIRGHLRQFEELDTRRKQCRLTYSIRSYSTLA